MSVERIDRYSVLVDDHRVTATPEQEARLREMDEEQCARFVKIVGGK